MSKPEVAVGQKTRLLASAYVLTGLRVRHDLARKIFAGVKAMKESETSLAILDEGAERESRLTILRQGTRKLGDPDEQTIPRLEGIADLERLRRIVDRATEA